MKRFGRKKGHDEYVLRKNRSALALSERKRKSERERASRSMRWWWRSKTKRAKTMSVIFPQRRVCVCVWGGGGLKRLDGKGPRRVRPLVASSALALVPSKRFGRRERKSERERTSWLKRWWWWWRSRRKSKSKRRRPASTKKKPILTKGNCPTTWRICASDPVAARMTISVP